MELREKYKKETEYSVMAYRQDYSGQTPYEDGFCDEYVEWLESKVKQALSADSVCKSLLAEEFNKGYIRGCEDSEANYNMNT